MTILPKIVKMLEGEVSVSFCKNTEPPLSLAFGDERDEFESES